MVCFALFLAVVSAWTGDLLPDTLYKVSSGDGSGFLIVMDGRLESQSKFGTYYVDGGELYAKAFGVELIDSEFGPLFKLSDGSLRSIDSELYEAPEYRNLPKTESYLQPKYKVKTEWDKPFGWARGFWTSYEVPYGESFAVTYGRKTTRVVGSMDEVELTMDIYCPQDDGDRVRPLILMIHGGAFFIGDKGQEEFYLWCRHFASLGYVAASINYRIGFRPTYNEVQRAGYRAVQDANAAIRYLINRSAYRIDPNRVFVAGTSAGAITALNVAFMMEKNRPEITFGGRLGDEGTIDMINPGDKGPFKILAVGNMWGAIQDLDMLRNSSASVISFHSEKDPIVPYGRGYPFQEYLGAVALNTLLFDRMYGSYEIDRELNRLQRRTELTTYPGDKHSVHFDSEGNLNRHFTEIQDKLVSFFSEEMKPKPVRLLRNGSDPQLFSIDTDQVRECFWKVEGGVILSCDSSSVRILLFPDSPFHELSVSGYYKTGQTFQESFSL